MHYNLDVQITQKCRLQICTFAFVSESQNRTTVFADGLVLQALINAGKMLVRERKAKNACR